jgi:hypothetical protein
MRTRTCCGVSVVMRDISSMVSLSAATLRSTSGGVQTPPFTMREIALRISSIPSVFGMKPEAPNSMQRRIAAGSSLADTTITGTAGYCARRYIRPEKPRTPGMVRSSRTRSISLSRSSRLATSSKVPASLTSS